MALLSCGTKQVNLNNTREEDFTAEPLASKLLPTLLVKVQRTSADTGSNLIEMKQELRKEIGDTLWNRKVGVSNGGNFSSSSFDIHFRVLDAKQAMPIIVNILKKKNLDIRTTIVERRNISPDSSTEKVIYPQ